MTRMPRVTGKKVVSVLKSTGFTVIRVTGSHHHLHKPGSKLVTVPVHSGETLSPMLIKSILEQACLNYYESRSTRPRAGFFAFPVLFLKRASPSYLPYV